MLFGCLVVKGLLRVVGEADLIDVLVVGVEVGYILEEGYMFGVGFVEVFVLAGFHLLLQYKLN